MSLFLACDGPQVAKVSAGGSHTVFLTTDGEVWTCGRGEYGLCGNGGTEDQLTPSPLEAFEDQIMVDVQVGFGLESSPPQWDVAFGFVMVKAFCERGR